MALPNLDDPKTVLDVYKASEYLISLGFKFRPSTLNAWRFSGRGPAYLKINHKVFYRPRDIDAWLAEHLIDPNSRGA